MSKTHFSIRLDPRTLILVNVLFCVAAFVLKNQFANSLCFGVAVILMIITGVHKLLIKFITAYMLILLGNHLFIMFGWNSLFLASKIMLYLFLKIMPMWMVAAIMFHTTRINELITALEKSKVHRGIILGIVVAFRFLPTMKYEIEMIRDSIRLRGLELSIGSILKRPVKSLEYIIIPLLFRSLKVSEELTKTALTRGIEYEGERSALFDVGFHLKDISVLLILTIGLLGVAYMNIGGV